MTSFINVHAKVKISNKVNSKKNMIRINLYELTTFVIGVNKNARVYVVEDSCRATCILLQIDPVAVATVRRI